MAPVAQILAFATLATGARASAAQAPAPPAAERTSEYSGARPLRRHLERRLPVQTRALDHGTLVVGVHGGVPHGYRVELGLGLLDHVSLGATASWWAGRPAPRWAPWAVLTAWRGQRFAASVGYDQVLHPVPRPGADADGFVQRTHNVLGSIELFQALFAVAVEAGISHTRRPLVGGPGGFRGRVLPAGGIALRVGTRRWGISVRGRMPVATAEIGADFRFGLFEFRSRGGWTPRPR